MALVSRDKEIGPCPGPTGADDPPRYRAFLSYSHADGDQAEWLHKAIERFVVPKALVGKTTAAGTVPKSLSPIFRDRHELAASSDLGQTIRAAIKQSRFLIVLCSPAAAASRWVNEEIVAFKQLHGEDRVLAAIVAGEPWASEMAGREGEECFPPALRERYDRRGHATGKRAEPIAADLRDGRDGREAGKLKLIAGMLGLGLDDLVRREAQRRQKRLTIIAAASIAGMALTSGLAVFAFDKRDEARDQRREAEGLVGFMLGDLRKELEPIQKLDALDAVGARALEYFEKQDKSELSDAALLQRSRALTLLGEIADTRGTPDVALAHYREAVAGTAELVRRRPDDPERLFDHAQNVFWVGTIARQRGHASQAERAFRQYKNIADKLVALQPRKPEFRLEAQYADTALGVILYERQMYREAARLFELSLQTTESLAASNPGNEDYIKSMMEALAWLADAQFGSGLMDEAIAKRERQVLLISKYESTSRDVEYRRKAVAARRALGRLLASRGDLKSGVGQLRRAVETSRSLMATEPQNMTWIGLGAGAQLDLADVLLADGEIGDAAVEARAGCDLIDRLLSRDRSIVEWRGLSIDCLNIKARVALAENHLAEAERLAVNALAGARALRSGNGSENAFAIASTLKLIGDIKARSGNSIEARRNWLAGLAAWPKGVAENPTQMAVRAEMMDKTGDGNAAAIRTRLEAIGYRRIF